MQNSINYNMAYDDNIIKILWQDFQDVNNKARRLARWGFVHLPYQNFDKVIWLKAGSDFYSVYLATELLGALHQSNYNVLLTFEQDYPTLFSEKLKGLSNIAIGYGPCSHDFAIKRFLKRINPKTILLINSYPYKNLLKNLQHQNVIAIDIPYHKNYQIYKRIYTINEAQYNSWHAHPNLAPFCDPTALFAKAQLEPHFLSLINAGQQPALQLFLYYSEHIENVENLFALWQQSELCKQAVLVIYSQNIITIPHIKISQWQRNALVAGDIIYCDDKSWLATIAASCQGIYVDKINYSNWWQLLASGCEIIIKEDNAFGLFKKIANISDIFSHWLYQDIFIARNIADQARKRLWQERRRVEEMLADLLEYL